LSTTAVFLLWEAMIVLEKQSVKIEKTRLLKDALAHSDWIHALMNTFFSQTDDLKKISKRLDGQNKTDLDKTALLQEDIGKLQRFRLSIIKENEDLVLLEYEIKALQWMKNIVTSKNQNIIFQEDFEDINENKYWIVPIILSELLWNAYKHSSFEDDKKKIYIPIGLAIVEDKINFYIENPLGDNKGRSSGLGTKTIRKRLELEYGKENFSLDSSKKQNEDGSFNYIVKLELPIKNKKL
jgi:two-component sensor histidine kinase